MAHVQMQAAPLRHFKGISRQGHLQTVSILGLAGAGLGYVERDK